MIVPPITSMNKGMIKKKNKMSESELINVESFIDEIIEPSMDISVDYAEIFVDQFVSDGILKDLPIVKTLYASYKTIESLHDAYEIKKILTFLRQCRKNDVSENNRLKFRADMEKDNEYKKKVIETILIYLNSYREIKKSEILANFLSAHIKGEIDFNRFKNLSICLDTIHPMCFDYLVKWAEVQTKVLPDNSDGRGITAVHTFVYNNPPDEKEAQELIKAAGLVNNQYLTRLGMELYKYGLCGL